MTDVNTHDVGQTIALPQPAEAQQAYLTLEPLLLALPAAEVRRVTVDVPHAVSIALGALPRINALRTEWAERLPRHSLQSLDALKAHAFAAYYAHLMTLPEAHSDVEKKALLDEAKPLRDRLFVSAELLGKLGLVNKRLVDEIRSGRGHVDLAGDLIALAALFTDAWEHIEDKTAVTSDEVERAGSLGAELIVLLSVVPRPKPQVLSPSELRARAFTLLWRTYEDCRHAVGYLRFAEGDAEKMTPSLFTRALRMKKRVAVAPEVVAPA